MKIFTSISILLIFLSSNLLAYHHEAKECDVVIKDRKFESGEIKKVAGHECRFQLEAGKKYKLKVCNEDKIAAEFESHSLKIEKIIKGGSSVKVRVKSLVKGETYEFEEEFGGYHCEFEGV